MLIHGLLRFQPLEKIVFVVSPRMYGSEIHFQLPTIVSFYLISFRFANKFKLARIYLGRHSNLPTYYTGHIVALKSALEFICLVDL